MLDPYYLLGVELNAAPDEIRVAYRRKAAEVHPDIQPLEKREWASERMKQLNAARELLLDPQRRAEYDERMRLEMEKARWRARRDAYVPPADFYPPRTRRRRWNWFTTLLAMGWLLLFGFCAIVWWFTPASPSSAPARDPFIWSSAAGILIVAGFWLGPLIITLLLVALLRYWKS
jgi:DnaJ-like protein